MRTSARAAIAAAAGAALALGTLAGAALPAAADASSFYLDRTSYGPNSIVTIDLGTLTRDCDTFWTASDIYVVPAGTVGPGSALTDAGGGPPNTIQSALGGSAIIDEVVAITQPSGSLGTGTYDIVEDTCQDGVLNGSDSVLRNAFSVTIPTDVPILPNAAIAAMKSDAEAQAEHWLNAAKAYAAFFAAATTYMAVSDAMSLTGFYLTYVCLVLPSHPDPNIPITWYCPTVSLTDTIRLQLAAVKTIVDHASYYAGIAADPPDPDFADPSTLAAVDAFTAEGGEPILGAVAEWAGAVARGAALAQAFLGSLEKYQGAAEENDVAAALMHAEDIQDYAVHLDRTLLEQSAAVDDLYDTTVDAGFNPDATLALLREGRERLATEGLTAEEERELRNAGVPEEAFEDIVETVLEDIDLDYTGSFGDLFNEQTAVNNAMGGTFVDLANAMNPVITDLEAALAAAGAVPYPTADAGGPYTATAGSPLTLTGACTDCVTFEWDLDADGAFDDATGAEVVHTASAAGAALVGLRVTDAGGRRAADYARVSVAASTRPPTITATSPPTDSPVRVGVGGAQSFSVTAGDPDGDPVTVTWYLDGDAVGTGANHTFTPDPAQDRLTYGLQARASDDSGAGPSVSWLVHAEHPDADGDGWNVNADCDDADAAVNPGATEVGGNGKDDDCDPSTPDTGPPVASFTVAPQPAVAGEPVQLSDTSTDPEGPVVAWSWDVDGDGVVDYTSAAPTHTYADPGTYAVTLTVTGEDDEEATTSADVVVTDRPVASFTYSPAMPDAGGTVTFTDTSTDADGIASREWDLDYDGVTFDVDSTEVSPSASFDSPTTVALRVRDTLGVTSAVHAQEVAVSGPPVAAFNPRPDNGGTNVALLDHGASVLETSGQWSTTYRAEEMLDVDYPGGDTPWLTPDPGTTPQGVTVDLGGVYLVDRIQVGSTFSTTTRVKDLEISLSTGGTGEIRTVVATALANNAGIAEFVLPEPVPARYLRYDALSNHGSTSYISTSALRALTGQVGTATVTFTDRTADPDDNLTSWHWDFGDGQTSTEQNPVHTYAAPGEYPVTLTVEDADGNESQATLVQRVVTPPVPAFTFPDTVAEGAGARFIDTTPVADRGIVARTWTWGYGPTSAGSADLTHSFPDNGTYDVTLSVTDTYGQQAAVTRTVTVENRPPTAEAGSNATLFVGTTWTPNGSVNDPSPTDRASLTCVWDFGDGESETIESCTSTRLRVPHTYAEAGTYTPSLTVTDKDGASATDTATVTVNKRGTYLNVYPVPGTAGGGDVSVRAMAWDTTTWQPLPGAEITLELDGDTAVVTTDADGLVSATLAIPPGGGTLTAEYAGDDHRLGASDSDEVSTVQRPPGDVVFMIDESGSMGGYQAAVRANVLAIADQLAQSIDYQIGLMGFGAGADHDLPGRPGHLPHLHVPPTDNLDDLAAAAQQLTTSGGTEPGINAVIDALAPSVGLRPGAGTCLVLIADEPVQQIGVTVDDARAALAANDAVLFSIITPGASSQGYADLALESGGAVFDIGTFGADPTPVLNALLGSCVTTILERPDLVVGIDDGRDVVSAGEHVTYTVTVDNVGEAGATGVEARVALPVGTSLVSASDGGTASDGVVSWPLTDLATGASLTRTLTVEIGAGPLPGTELALVAEANDDGTLGPDLTPANNVDTDVDTVVAVPTLTVVTAVTNDDGGTALPGDFTIGVLADGTVVTSAPGSTDGVAHTLTAGDYAVAPQGGPGGYTMTFAEACAGTGDVSLAAGDDATCVVTFDDASSALTVETVVVNDDGGTALAGDVTIDVLAEAAVAASAPGSADGVTHPLAAGDYTVAPQASPAGYTVTFGEACADAGQVSLAVGDEATCVVTLDDVAPVLTVEVVVVNDDGGTAVPADVTIDVLAGATVIASAPGSTDGVAHTLTAGEYAVAPQGDPAGYAVAFGEACADAGEVSLAVGDEATCVVTLDDASSVLTVETVVVNDDGGTAEAGAFTVAVEPAVDGLAAAVQSTHELSAGAYRLVPGDEPAGYAVSVGGACTADGGVVLVVGDNRTCVVTFDDVGPTLTLELTVDNTGGGTAVAADFEVTVDGEEAALGVAHAVDAGSRSVALSGPPRYALAIGGGCSADGTIDLALAQAATCSLTATFVPDEPTEEPTTDEPTEEPTTDEPTDEPTTDEPTEEPTTDEPTDEPTTDEPTEDPTTARPTPTPTQSEDPSGGVGGVTDTPTRGTTPPVTDRPDDDLPPTGRAGVLALLTLAAVALLAGLAVRRRVEG
ncbi:PKD domain-containing protein [Georgenia wangjunii]|uniref:PKD domain-containing protein n=1 Tax=Georgenia wangjunii TaxID=3117730 RepID=UPI002F25FA7C